MAPRSCAPKVVPASTELLLTLLLFSWMSFLCPNPVQKECLRKSTCILACQAPLRLYWSALWPSDGHRLSKSALHDLALTLGLEWRNFFAALSRIGSGHFWWEPDHHSKSMVWSLGVSTLPKSPWSHKMEMGNCQYIAFLKNVCQIKVWELCLVFHQTRWKNSLAGSALNSGARKCTGSILLQWEWSEKSQSHPALFILQDRYVKISDTYWKKLRNCHELLQYNPH